MALQPIHGQGQRAVRHAELSRDDHGSGEPWKLVDCIKSFNYLTYDGGQFSTSRGRGVMDQALEILPADYWRWWSLSHAPETSDAESPGRTFRRP